MGESRQELHIVSQMRARGMSECLALSLSGQFFSCVYLRRDIIAKLRETTKLCAYPSCVPLPGK